MTNNNTNYRSSKYSPFVRFTPSFINFFESSKLKFESLADSFEWAGSRPHKHGNNRQIEEFKYPVDPTVHVAPSVHKVKSISDFVGACNDDKENHAQENQSEIANTVPNYIFWVSDEGIPAREKGFSY
jgi:hypothetical protein